MCNASKTGFPTVLENNNKIKHPPLQTELRYGDDMRQIRFVSRSCRSRFVICVRTVIHPTK